MFRWIRPGHNLARPTLDEVMNSQDACAPTATRLMAIRTVPFEPMCRASRRSRIDPEPVPNIWPAGSSSLIRPCGCAYDESGDPRHRCLHCQPKEGRLKLASTTGLRRRAPEGRRQGKDAEPHQGARCKEAAATNQSTFTRSPAGEPIVSVRTAYSRDAEPV